jgi:hypothetical protein
MVKHICKKSRKSMRCPTPMERYRMLALGRKYNDHDLESLIKNCNMTWTLPEVKDVLDEMDSINMIMPYENEKVVVLRNFVDEQTLKGMNVIFDKAIRQVGFHAGTDASSINKKVASRCKYLYLKTRKEDDIPNTYKNVITNELQHRIHEAVFETLSDIEKECFKHIFEKNCAREISVVHYPTANKQNKTNIGIDAHVDDVVMRTAMIHIKGNNPKDNIYIRESIESSSSSTTKGCQLPTTDSDNDSHNNDDNLCNLPIISGNNIIHQVDKEKNCDGYELDENSENCDGDIGFAIKGILLCQCDGDANPNHYTHT